MNMDGGNNEVISFIVVSVIFFAVEQVAERELVKISLPPPISGRNVVIDVFFLLKDQSVIVGFLKGQSSMIRNDWIQNFR